jgi:hypothetical protein
VHQWQIHFAAAPAVFPWIATPRMGGSRSRDGLVCPVSPRQPNKSFLRLFCKKDGLAFASFYYVMIIN